MSVYPDNEVLQNILAVFIASIQRKDNFFDILQGLAPHTVNFEVVAYTDDLQIREGTELLGFYEDGFVHFYTQPGDHLGTAEIENVETLKRLLSGTASITVKEVVQRNDEVFLELLIR